MRATNYQLPTANYKGFTIIEALVFLFIFIVITMAFFEAYATSTRLIIESKNRLGATALANQKMEIIRSIDYDTVGTKHWNGNAWVYGIPAGDLLEDETISVNTRQYAVHTFVQYVDDPFDGQLGHNPSDAIPNDYKRVRLSVSWGGGGLEQTVSTFANISPNGIETSAGGGVLTINILDLSGAGISGVTVHLVGSSTGVDVTTQTDSTGNITLPGTPASLPPGTKDYALTVSKGSYYGAVTYPPYPTSAYNPTNVHMSVVAGVLNPITIVIDRSADIAVHTRDPFDNDLPNIATHIIGGSILGTDPADIPPTAVYSFDQSFNTDASGNKTFADESYGQYTLSTTSAQYQLYKLNPEEATADVFTVLAGVNKDITAILLDTQIGSAKIQVVNLSDSTIIAGASVHLSNSSLGYDVTQTTDQYGFVYFPAALPELVAGTYDVAVSATGFENYTGTIAINGALETKTVSLNPD